MSETEPRSTDDAFWRFSLAFYALPDVSQALIALQDQHGFDVNLMLFALWLGISGHGRLSCERLVAAERAVCTIRSEVVEPLRTLRRRLKDHPDEDIRSLREGVRALEFAGEKLVQTRLARLAGHDRSEPSHERRLAVARANLALYLGPDRMRCGEATVIMKALAAFARRI